MKKILSLILALAMVFSLMLMIVPHAEEAAEATGELEVSQAKLIFGDCVYLLIAVDYSAVGSADGITLKITNNKTGEVSTIAPDASIEAPANCVAFKYIDLGAKNMGDELTLQALKDGAANGDSKTYSILEYALKASAEGDEKLTNLVNAMIEYGADAQDAWDYEGTYDLTKEYGLVIVGGATKATRKYIAEVGATFTPEMDAAKFPAGAELYGIDFEPADSVVVAEGVSRYYYFGTDIYGDKYGSADYYNDYLATNLDFDSYTGNQAIYLYDKDNYTYKDSKGNDLTCNYWGKNTLTHTSAGVVGLKNGSMAGWTAANCSIWNLTSDKLPTGTGKHYTPTTDISTTDYKGGKLLIDKGYLLIDCYSEYINEETGERYNTVGYTLSENYNYAASGKPLPLTTCLHDPDNFLKDGKFTIGFSLAKKAGVDFVTGSKCFIALRSTQADSTPLFTTDGANVLYGDTVIATIREFTGDAPSQDDFTTFYMVFDANTNTVTVHNDDGISKTLPITFAKANVTDLKTWLNGTTAQQGFFWNMYGGSGEAYINRITYMVGDIFA